MSSTNPWSAAALALRGCEIDLGWWQRLLHAESPLYDAAAHQRSIERYRASLLGLRHAVEGVLALLPEPEPMPEKVAGSISPSVHA